MSIILFRILAVFFDCSSDASNFNGSKFSFCGSVSFRLSPSPSPLSIITNLCSIPFPHITSTSSIFFMLFDKNQ